MRRTDAQLLELGQLAAWETDGGAVFAATVPCHECAGHGWVFFRDVWATRYAELCETCGGVGAVPADVSVQL